jgi:hypothetical protein
LERRARLLRTLIHFLGRRDEIVIDRAHNTDLTAGIFFLRIREIIKAIQLVKIINSTFE